MFRLCILICVALPLAVPAAAFALELGAGWVHADLGLDQEGDGFTLGAGGTWNLGAAGLDLSAAGEFVRVSAVQPMFVASPELGPVTSDAEVTLSLLQTTVCVGCSLPLGPLRLRPYAGLGLSLKVDESWDRVAGDVAVDYAYEDLDAAALLGLRVQPGGRVFLDTRLSRGLLDQVVTRDGSAAKAVDDGVSIPEAGDKVWRYQVGLGVAF